MPEGCEQRAAIGYVLMLARRGRAHRRIRDFVFDWLEEAGPSAGLDPEDACAERYDAQRSGDCRKRCASPTGPAFEDVRRRLEARARELRHARPSALERRIGELAGQLGLDSLERSLLAALVRLRLPGPARAIHSWWAEHCRTGTLGWTQLLAMMLGVPEPEIAERLAGRGRLIASGVVARGCDDEPEPLSTLLSAFRTASGRRQDIAELLLAAPRQAALEWGDFDHIAADREPVRRILEGALAVREAAVHILLYGPPGTGKTQFAHTLAARLAVPLYGVGETGEDGRELGRGGRIGALRLSQKLLAGRAPALLLFDEMEDIFNASPEPEDWPYLSPGLRRGSKIFINRLLETTPVPVLWTANSLAALPAAVIRRMTYAVRFEVPPPRARARIWRRELTRQGIRFADSEVDDLARRFESPPALAATAVRAVRLSGGGTAALERAMEGIGRALGQDAPGPRCAKPAFAPDLVNAEGVDLPDLIDRLSRAGSPPAVSLCLYGPPGSGKSLFVRHLAESMGLEILERRASDILSMWVGGSERNIARAFAEARRRRAFLVLDEADSLLAERRHALCSWEITQVNEMLAWMDCHALPFACTTNLMDHLDTASLRRFTFRIRLSWMTPEQARRAFRHFFHLEPPSALDALDRLVPADFALVLRRAACLGLEGDAQALLDMLREEQAAKPGAARAIGFVARA